MIKVIIQTTIEGTDFFKKLSDINSTSIGFPSTVKEKVKTTENSYQNSPLYKVLLHNDPINTMDYVVLTLQEVVPRLTEQDAISIMLEAHNNGVGLVIVCDLEPAEFYSETLNMKG